MGSFFCFNFSKKKRKKSVKKIKNAQKIEKMKKKRIFFAKNLVVSFFFCNFAPSYKNKGKQTTKSTTKNHNDMNKIYYTKSLGQITLNTATINRNFRIKVAGMVNNQKVNKLVGVSGLLAILGNSWEKLIKFVLRAFNSMADKTACKIYGGAMVTFYAK